MRLKSASAQSSDAFALRTSGTRTGSNAWPADEPETRLELRRVGVGFAQRRVGFRRGDPNQDRAGRDARAALHRRADDPAAGLGGDVSLLVGRERAGDPQEPIDGLAPDCRRPGSATGAGSGRAAALVRSPLHAAESSAAVAAPVSRSTRTLRIMTVVPRYDCIRMRARS